MIIDEDYIIEHFGVKGQKWGVRKKAVIGLVKSGLEEMPNVQRQMYNKKMDVNRAEARKKVETLTANTNRQRNSTTSSSSKTVTRDRARKSINKGDAAMKALLIGLGTVNVGLIVAAHKIR